MTFPHLQVISGRGPLAQGQPIPLECLHDSIWGGLEMRTPGRPERHICKHGGELNASPERCCCALNLAF